MMLPFTVRRRDYTGRAPMTFSNKKAPADYERAFCRIARLKPRLDPREDNEAQDNWANEDDDEDDRPIMPMPGR